MIGSIIIGIVLFILAWIGLYFLYGYYKEREWQRNNQDELLWTEQPVKKDPGLE